MHPQGIGKTGSRAAPQRVISAAPHPQRLSLEAHVETVLTTAARCRAGETLVMAVSGGLDSMVLLHVVSQLAPRHRWRLVVAHFNHRLRGRASGADARFVRLAARRLGWPVAMGAGDVRALARQQSLSLEMAARQARHAFLAQAAKKAGARQILLAHHADDQVELFFLRLLQGAGPAGLKGMETVAPSPALRPIRLVRPLLDVPRRDLEKYAAQHGLTHREDQSNASLAPWRNRLRHQLLPLLRSWQPGLNQVILRTMEVLRAEDAFLAEELSCRRQRSDSTPAQWPLALQRRHLAAELLRLGHTPNFELIEFLRQHPDHRITVAPGQCLCADKDLALHRIPVCITPPHEQARWALSLASSGQIRWQGRFLKWQIKTCRSQRLPAARPGTEWFDADAVGPVIVLRHWQPGDRFWPIGTPRAMKLQDFFVNEKVPAAERRRRLLAEAADGRIFWVEGLRIAEPFKVRPQTRRLLRWQWQTG